MADREITPYGCRHCGEPRPHGQQFLDGIGVHTWVAPTDRQILARMRLRRAFRLQLLDAAGAPFIDGREYRDRHGNDWQAVLGSDDFLLIGTADGWRREWERLQWLPGAPVPTDRIDDAETLVRSSGPMTLIATLEDQ